MDLDPGSASGYLRLASDAGSSGVADLDPNLVPWNQIWIRDVHRIWAGGWTEASLRAGRRRKQEKLEIQEFGGAEFQQRQQLLPTLIVGRYCVNKRWAWAQADSGPKLRPEPKHDPGLLGGRLHPISSRCKHSRIGCTPFSQEPPSSPPPKKEVRYVVFPKDLTLGKFKSLSVIAKKLKGRS